MKKLSIIIPAFNEAKTIGEVLKRVAAVDLDKVQKEIIVIDDGSTDETFEKISNLKSQISNLRIIRHPNNRGKGWAIRTGIKAATGDIIGIQDGDLEYDPQDFPKLIKPIIQGNYKVVYGSRRLKKSNRQYKKLSFYLAANFLTFLANLLYRAGITDEATCYKFFASDVLKKMNLKARRFEFCPEVTAKVCKMGLKIKEVPISYQPRDAKAGKKIKWRDGLEAIWTLIKYRFVS